MRESSPVDAASVPQPDAVLEMLNMAEAQGSTCAVLTPAIKAKLRDLEPGRVLLVRVDDPSARLDVHAWCALTGNPLLATTEENGTLSFLIQKSEKKARGD
jgi:TusA-related sulfurtransferase